MLASTALEICFWPRRLKYSETVAGAGGDGDVAENLGGEAAAEVLGFDGDGEGLRLEASCRPGQNAGILRFAQNDDFLFITNFVSIERGEGEVVDGGGFAGDAVVVHGVDTVGGDVHFEEVAVVGAEVVDAFDGDAAEGEVVG